MVQEHPARTLFQDAFAGRLSRRELLQRAAVIGLSAPVVAALGHVSASRAHAATEGELNLTYYNWILDLHPDIPAINEDFAKTFPLKAETAPTEGFGFERFVAEARDQNSTWDMYIGVTPFLEMIQLAESGTIEPWDAYIAPEILNDITPAIREESMFNGKFYVWPFLLDVIVQGWNAEIVGKAGLDPEVAPKTWDEYLANARKVQESGAAPFGATFDRWPWRSLIPITHSIDTNVYNEDGTFMWTSDATVQALEIVKQMKELANPDVLNEGTTDGGVNGMPDEAAFAAQQAGYYIKYQNAHLRFASTWPDPSQLRLAALPIQTGGAGGTVFWDTGAVLFTYGKNKQQAANYLKALTYDQRIWEHSVTGDLPEESAVGQLPVYQSVWTGYETNRPPWMTDWAFAIYNGLGNAKAIAPSKLAFSQFTVATPHYMKYLTGETSDAMAALKAADDAVKAEMAKLGA